MPGQDLSIRDGDTISLGGTTVTLYVTPGHTLGTISPVFDVSSRGETHRVLEWGGTGFNFGADMPRLDAYIGATERMRTLAAQQNIDVMISNHSGFDQAPDKLDALYKPLIEFCRRQTMTKKDVDRLVAVARSVFS